MNLEIKICGITTLEDAQAACALGVDYLGFNFYAGSPRAISVDRATMILKAVNQSCKGIGIFVNAPCRDVESVVNQCGLWAAQIHGNEEAVDYARASVRLWRALKLLPTGSVPDPAAWQAERYVVDAAVPGVYGGSGVTADWVAAADMGREYPILLAGGLTPDNVARAVQEVAPRGVDVSSGVEVSPGIKDHEKMKVFIERAREAAGGAES